MVIICAPARSEIRKWMDRFHDVIAQQTEKRPGIGLIELIGEISMESSAYVDMNYILSQLDQKQVCRTCQFNTNRFAHLGPQWFKLPKNEQIACAPGLDLAVKKVTDKATVTPVTIKATGQAPPGNARHIVSSCGQSLRRVCLSCQRFRPVTVKVAVERWPGGPTWNRNVTIGGHCSIPPEGIMTKDGLKQCDPLPVGSRIEASCNNCAYRFNSTMWTDNHDLALSVSEIELDPYEEAQIRHAVLNNQYRECPSCHHRPHLEEACLAECECGDNRSRQVIHPNVEAAIIRCQAAQQAHGGWNVNFQIRAGINAANILKAQVPLGVWQFFPARLVETYSTKTGPSAWKVVVGGSGVETIIDRDDDHIEVLPTTRPDLVVLKVYLPHHKDLLVVPHTTVATKRWDAIPLAPGQKEVDLHNTPSLRPRAADRVIRYKDLDYSREDLVDPNCPRCCRYHRQPCYYHARAPRRNLRTGLIEFERGWSPGEMIDRGFVHSRLGQAILVTHPDGSELSASYIRNNYLHIAEALLRAQDKTRPELATKQKFFVGMGHCFTRAGNPAYDIEEIKMALRRLQGKIDGLSPGKPRASLFNFARPSRLEPYKTYCAYNLHHPGEGIDFREAWNDRFGTSRSEQSTNIVTESAMAVPIRGIGRRVINRGGHLGSRNEQSREIAPLALDEFYSAPKAEAFSEWLRTTSSLDRAMYGRASVGEQAWITERIMRAHRERIEAETGEKIEYAPAEFVLQVIHQLPPAGPEVLAAENNSRMAWSCRNCANKAGDQYEPFQFGAKTPWNDDWDPDNDTDPPCPACGDKMLPSRIDPPMVAYDVTLPDETYSRRDISGVLLPDGMGWLQRNRLSEMVCEHWTERSFGSRKPRTLKDL